MRTSESARSRPRYGVPAPRCKGSPALRLAPLLLMLIAAMVGCARQASPHEGSSARIVPLQARIVAVGITGTQAIRQLGTLLPDGAVRYDSVLAATLLNRSSERSGGALFAVVQTDGSVVQVHGGGGVDGLAPAGTVAPHPADVVDGGVGIRQTGVIFNWVPDPVLYLTDPNRNAILALTLLDDGTRFRVDKTRHLDAPELNLPIDLAPAVLEAINPDVSSSTTLAGGADFYVASRGNGTIVRMRQDGAVLAVRSIEVPGLGTLGPGRLNGIAAAPDANRIWVSISGPVPPDDREGAILELPAFGADRAAAPLAATAQPDSAPDAPAGVEVALQMGLGPAFNGRSCADCHAAPIAGGMGTNGLATVLRVGKLDYTGYDPMLGRGGPVARMHVVSELGIACSVLPGVPAGANLISVRNAPPLFGLGLVDEVPDATILAGAVARARGIHGRANIVSGADGQQAVGRFGWKAQVPRLEQFVATALRDEHGITSPLAPRDLTADGVRPDCAAYRGAPKDAGALVDSLTAFVRSLEPLPPQGRQPRGNAIFVHTGCADCHTPTLAAGDKVLALYSDLLLHDMGPALNDGVVQGQAQGSDWRTTPLWGLSVRARFLHDGRAHSIESAILAHGGEAAQVVQGFRGLNRDERSALLAFLSSL
jgi:mono/diheme cytochrome c family protein